MVLTLDKERFDEQFKRLICEAETGIEYYTDKAAKDAAGAYTCFRKSRLVQRVHLVLKSEFNSYGKRKYVRRTHDILCECSWNPECNPSIRKFYDFMMDNTK